MCTILYRTYHFGTVVLPYCFGTIPFSYQYSKCVDGAKRYQVLVPGTQTKNTLHNQYKTEEEHSRKLTTQGKAKKVEGGAAYDNSALTMAPKAGQQQSSKSHKLQKNSCLTKGKGAPSGFPKWFNSPW